VATGKPRSWQVFTETVVYDMCILYGEGDVKILEKHPIPFTYV